MAGIILSRSSSIFNPTAQFLPKFNGTTFVDSLLNEYDGGVQMESGAAILQVDDVKFYYGDGINIFEHNIVDADTTITSGNKVTINTSTIELSGDISVTAAPALTHGPAANRWLEIKVGGSSYKIALLNP